MISTIKPTSRLRGDVSLPASKSYSIRAFIIALCGGRSCIKQPSDCDDAAVAVSVARHLGASIVRGKNNTWKITAKKNKLSLSKINVKESGTTLRFLLPLLSLYGQKATVIGEGTLRGRPNHLLTRVLRAQGVIIRGKSSCESVPISLSGGKLRGGKIFIDGSLSSQFISALLIACPQLEKDSKIVVKGRQVVSSDYITMTRQILEKAGVSIASKGSREFNVLGRQKFKGLRNFTVPSDLGLAAFLLAAAALLPSDLNFQGSLKDDLVQADGRILDFLSKMGVHFTKTSRSIKIKGPFKLKGGTFSLKDCPDLVPIMSVLALFAKGKTRLCHIKHARVKESNRISDLRKELLKIGANVKEKTDELIIQPLDTYKSDIALDPHHDHRLAMAFCVLGLIVGTKVKDMGCVSKSYPGFVKDFKSMGARISNSIK